MVATDPFYMIITVDCNRSASASRERYSPSPKHRLLSLTYGILK